MNARDYEMLVLCGFMRNRKAFAEFSPQLTPESFTEPDLHDVFEAMQDAGPQFTAPELAAVVEPHGGRALLADIYKVWRHYGVDKTFPTRDIERYANVVERSGRLHQIEMVVDEAKRTLSKKDRSKLKDTEFVGNLVGSLVDIEFAAGRQQGFRDYDTYLSEFVNQLGRTLRGEMAGNRTKTHMRSFDSSTGGGLPQGLIVVGGLPGSGKTQLALQWVLNIATFLRDQGEVGVCAVNSAEMAGMSLASRAVLSGAEIDSALLRTGGYNKDKAALKRIRKEIEAQKGLPLFIDDSSILTSNIISARVSSLRARYRKVVLVVTDFAELIRDKGESVEQRVATVFVNAAALAKMLKCPVVLLSQLSRAVDLTGSRVPSMRHLRYSGMAEATADMIVLIYNPMYYISGGVKITPHPQMPPVDGTSYLILAKHRDGPVGFLPMSWVAKYARWGDLGPKVKELRTYSAED